MSTKDKGFASMTVARQREIAQMGGKAVKPENRSFSKHPEVARAAGRLGGLAVPKEKRLFYNDRELAAEAGRKGGLARQAKRKQQDAAE